jgi:hypothetical protein
VATRVRDWATVDYYELLGVEAGASGEEIARAFRAAAKVSHPDATGDPVAAERFKDLAAAYAVLSDRRMRRDYDQVRAAAAEPRPAPSARVAPQRAPRPGPVSRRDRPSRWNRKRAWIAVIVGALVTVLGLSMAALTWHLHGFDASQRARFVPVTANRLDAGQITFDTRQGAHIVTKEPEQHGEATGTSDTVGVRYDPANPRHVIVDSGTFGRDITLAIVALKLLIGGPVFFVLGTRWLLRNRRLTPPTPNLRQ